MRQGQGVSERPGPSPDPPSPNKPLTLDKALNPVGHHSFVTRELRGLPQPTHRVAQGSKTLVHNKKHR